jgi:hypothetical protein
MAQAVKCLPPKQFKLQDRQEKYTFLNILPEITGSWLKGLYLYNELDLK